MISENKRWFWMFCFGKNELNRDLNKEEDKNKQKQKQTKKTQHQRKKETNKQRHKTKVKRRKTTDKLPPVSTPITDFYRFGQNMFIENWNAKREKKLLKIETKFAIEFQRKLFSLFFSILWKNKPFLFTFKMTVHIFTLIGWHKIFWTELLDV